MENGVEGVWEPEKNDGYGARDLGKRAMRRRKKASAFSRAARLRNYQSNLRPNRHSRGGTIVVGCKKLVAEPQLMFCAAFVFVRL